MGICDQELVQWKQVFFVEGSKRGRGVKKRGGEDEKSDTQKIAASLKQLTSEFSIIGNNENRITFFLN